MASLAAAGVEVSYPEREMAFDSAKEILEIVVGSGMFGAVAPILIAYIKARLGQKVAVSFYESGKVKQITAPTPKDVEQLAAILNPPAAISPGEAAKKPQNEPRAP